MVLGQRVRFSSHVLRRGWYAGNRNRKELAAGIFYVEVNRTTRSVQGSSTFWFMDVDTQYKPHYKIPKYVRIDGSGLSVLPERLPEPRNQYRVSHSFEVSTVRRKKSVRIGDVWIRSVDKSVEKKART
jgi:hypothetical protein